MFRTLRPFLLGALVLGPLHPVTAHAAMARWESKAKAVFTRSTKPAVKPQVSSVSVVNAEVDWHPMAKAALAENLPVYGKDEVTALSRVARIGASGKLERVAVAQSNLTATGYHGEGSIAAGVNALKDARSAYENIYGHYFDYFRRAITWEEMGERIHGETSRLSQIAAYAQKSGNVDDDGHFSKEVFQQVFNDRAGFAASGLVLGGEMGRIRFEAPYASSRLSSTRAGVTDAILEIDEMLPMFESASGAVR